jgi:hypothetical protein
MHNNKKKSPRLDHNNNLIIQTRKEKIKPFQQRQWRMQRGVCVGRGGGMNTRTDTGGTGGTGRTKQNIQMRLTGSNNNNSHHSHASVSPPLDLLEAPSIKTIIYFAIPAIGIWLCGPLLSLIDTSAVGLLSGTAQQAALNPAITITEDGALLVVCKILFIARDFCTHTHVTTCIHHSYVLLFHSFRHFFHFVIFLFCFVLVVHVHCNY